MYTLLKGGKNVKSSIVDSSLQITLSRFLLFLCSLKHSVISWKTAEKRKLVHYTNKEERAVWQQQQHQGHYCRTYLKTSHYVNGLSVKRAKGDKQGETAYWGQEFPSHLKTIIKNKVTMH
jgi:hypothetical protein